MEIVPCLNIVRDKQKMIRGVEAETLSDAMVGYIGQLRNEAWTAVQSEIINKWTGEELDDCLVDHIEGYHAVQFSAPQKRRRVLTIYYNNYQTLTINDLYDRLVLNA